ncbi:vegetative incompatibility protein HET-E-1 [Rhizoctonia solani AG-3 Rhs1AP]|nr:vegetative incompatibility protein HET-E-1 [Rhizoctonia solani AG-3 Rhs1AP]
MFSHERSGTYFYDVVEHSQLLARRCFLVMKNQLRFNICNLASSFVPDKEVENIEQRIKASISPTLAYACRYWASHLGLALRSDMLLTLLDEFLCHRLLFWMEVLSLRRELLAGVHQLLKIQQWLEVNLLLSKLVHYIDDAHGFITTFAMNPTLQSTPHIYVSSLSLCPCSSSVRKNYRKQSRGLLDLKGSLMEVRESAPLAVWNTGLGKIYSLALSPDGTRVAIGSSNTTVHILSAYDGTAQVGPLQGHVGYVSSVAFSPDGARVVSASFGSIRIWNAINGTLIAGPFKNHTGYINTVSFSPDGTRVVSGGHDCAVRVWNAHDGSPSFGRSIDHVEPIYCVQFSPSGALIASPSVNHTIQLWDSRSGTPTGPPFTGHTARVECLAFTPDGTRLVSGSRDATVRIWNVFDGSPVTSPLEGHTFLVDSVTVSPDGMRVASAGNGTVRVWDIENGALIAGPFSGHDISSKCLVYSPDGTRVFSGSPNGTICVQNVRDGMLFPTSLPPQDVLIGIKSVIFCPENANFMSSDGYGSLRIWDTIDGSYITSPNKAKIIPSSLSTLSPDGSAVACTTNNGNLQIVDTINGTPVAGPFEIERSELSTLSFSRNNRAVIMGYLDGTIKVCDLKSGNTTVGSFMAHHKRVSSISESPDCSLLVSHSNYEMAIRVWNIVTPALDLQLFSTSIDPSSGHSYAAVYDGWSIREDGWAVNNSQHLLFWLPPDLASAWCSPYATLAITKAGTLQVPKQKLFVGDQWTRCYIPD